MTSRFAPLGVRTFRSENPYFSGRKTFLGSIEVDGDLHAAYPTATRTLCGLPAPDGERDRRPPTCAVCVETAVVFDEIDCSVPDHWRPDYVPTEECAA